MLQVLLYTAQDWILIIGAIVGGMIALGNLWVGNNANKTGLVAADKKIVELEQRLKEVEAELGDCTGQLESRDPPLYRRKLPEDGSRR